MLESELIITVTNVGCLRLWVFAFLCLLVLFSARRSGFRHLVREHYIFPTFSATQIYRFSHTFFVSVLTAECVRNPKRVNLQQINTDAEKR